MRIAPFLIRLMHFIRPAMELGPEDQLALEVSTACRAWTLEGRLPAVWFHVPNEGGGKNKRKAQIELGLKRALGMIPGVGDYVFIGPGVEPGAIYHDTIVRHRVLLIELKAGRNGQSDNQKDFEAWADLIGVAYKVCRSLAEVERELSKAGLLIPRRAL